MIEPKLAFDNAPALIRYQLDVNSIDRAFDQNESAESTNPQSTSPYFPLRLSLDLLSSLVTVELIERVPLWRSLE